MKVLIWVGCFFVATLLNTILGYATGIKVGYLIFYFAVYFVAKKLCQKWDEHKEATAKQEKTAQQATISVEDQMVTTSVDQIRFCRKCGEKLIDGSRFCRKCGTEVVINEE